MENLQTLITGFLGSICFAITFRTPKKYLVLTVSIGLIAFYSAKISSDGSNLIFIKFVCALVIGLIAHLLSRLSNSPTQGFLIPGIIFLVPGTAIYKGFSAAIQNNTTEALSEFLTAGAVAFGISFALLVANWLMPTKKTL